MVAIASVQAISDYHYKSEFEFRSWRGTLDTKMTLCEGCQWFSLSTLLVCSTINTDHHDIIEMLLKVSLNTHNTNPVTMETFICQTRFFIIT